MANNPWYWPWTRETVPARVELARINYLLAVCETLKAERGDTDAEGEGSVISTLHARAARLA